MVSAFDTDAVERALREAEAEVVIDQLTSLPKDPAHLAAALPGDRKLRIEGGGNLYRAAEANGVRRYLQQSSGFFLKPGSGIIKRHLQSISEKRLPDLRCCLLTNPKIEYLSQELFATSFPQNGDSIIQLLCIENCPRFAKFLLSPIRIGSKHWI